MSGLISSGRAKFRAAFKNAASKSSFQHAQTFLHYTGLSATRPSHIGRIILVIFFGVNICLVILQLISISQVYDHDLRDLVRYTLSTLVKLTAMVKLGTAFYRRQDVGYALQEIERYMNEMNSDVGKKTRAFTETLVKGVMGLTFSACTVFTIMFPLRIPDFYAKRSFEFYRYFPYDEQMSPMFDVTVLVVTTATTAGFILVLLCDVLFFFPLIHVVGAFRVLRTDIEHLKDAVMKDGELNGCMQVVRPMAGRSRREPAYLKIRRSRMLKDNRHVRMATRARRPVAENVHVEDLEPVAEVNREMEVRLRRLLQNHQRLIKYVALGNSISAANLAWQMFLTMVAALMGLYVSTLSREFGNSEFLMMFGGVVLFIEVFFLCWFSNYLTDESGLVADAAYACDWLTASAGFKSALRILMVRAQKPLFIRAAGLPLSRRMFKTICRGCYYLHTLLKNLYFGVKIIPQEQ